MSRRAHSFVLDADTASTYADCCLRALDTRYPYAMQHLSLSATDRPTPDRLHPIFFGSYDWHSSVHMHWSLVRLLRLYPALPQRAEILKHFKRRFTTASARRELDYCQQFPGYERPYGWAWLHTLWAELQRSDDATLQTYAQLLTPLADHFFSQWKSFLLVAGHPQRAGLHSNSAFAMLLSLRAAQSARNTSAVGAIRKRATAWFGRDADYPARYEPGGNDFLSNGLCEAVLMSEVAPGKFEEWWRRFAPSDMASWQRPVKTSSRTDGQLVHIDGLNLSRAWCLRLLADRLPGEQHRLEKAARLHLRAGLPHVTSGDFVATHWLVSFALLALSDQNPDAA